MTEADVVAVPGRVVCLNGYTITYAHGFRTPETLTFRGRLAKRFSIQPRASSFAAGTECYRAKKESLRR
jgi:hypothetical protein